MSQITHETALKLLEALRRLKEQCEAEFMVDGMWSDDGQAVTHRAWWKAKDAITQAEGELNRAE